MDKTRFIYYNRRYYPCHIVVFVVRLVTGAAAPTALMASMSIYRTLQAASIAARQVMVRVAATVLPASTSMAMVVTSAPTAAHPAMVPAAVIALQGITSIKAWDCQ